MELISYLASNIFKQPALFLGIIAALGLILQKEKISNVIRGSLKTVFGVIILFQGVNMLSAAVKPLSIAFSSLYSIPEANYFNPDIAWEILADYGTEIALVLVFAFTINLLVARFTPIKHIYLTGHIFFWMAYLLVGVAVNLGLKSINLIVFATIWLSAYIIISPALMKPLVSKIVGSDSFTIGHSATIYCLYGNLLGKVVGDKNRSCEDIKIPKSLRFLRETTISASLIMFIIYLVIGLLMVSETASQLYGSSLNSIYTLAGAKYDLFSFALMASFTFGAGLTILLTGVRLMLAEIIPAFKGIAKRMIPNATLALDIPMIFPYRPNSLLIGFVVSMFASVLTIFVLASFNLLTYAVIPLVIACFFDVAPAAIFANEEGGIKAALIASFTGGVILVLLLIASLAVFKNTTAGFLQLYGGNGFSLWSLIAQFVSGIFL